jgi:hypothetical protein
VVEAGQYLADLSEAQRDRIFASIAQAALSPTKAIPLLARVAKETGADRRLKENLFDALDFLRSELKAKKH